MVSWVCAKKLGRNAKLLHCWHAEARARTIYRSDQICRGPSHLDKTVDAAQCHTDCFPIGGCVGAKVRGWDRRSSKAHSRYHGAIVCLHAAHTWVMLQNHAAVQCTPGRRLDCIAIMGGCNDKNSMYLNIKMYTNSKWPERCCPLGRCTLGMHG